MKRKRSQAASTPQEGPKRQREDRENPMRDHVPGHLGYHRGENLKRPRIRGIDDGIDDDSSSE